jgi:hypothetical protein
MPNENEDGGYVVGSNRNLPMLTGNGPHSKQASGALGSDIEHVESLDSLEKSKKPRSLKHVRANVQKHWRRFWCCYLVAAIIFLAIFLPVL